MVRPNRVAASWNYDFESARVEGRASANDAMLYADLRSVGLDVFDVRDADAITAHLAEWGKTFDTEESRNG